MAFWVNLCSWHPLNPLALNFSSTTSYHKAPQNCFVKQGNAFVTDLPFFWPAACPVVIDFHATHHLRHHLPQVVAIVVSPLPLVDPIPQVSIHDSGLWIPSTEQFRLILNPWTFTSGILAQRKQGVIRDDDAMIVIPLPLQFWSNGKNGVPAFEENSHGSWIQRSKARMFCNYWTHLDESTLWRQWYSRPFFRINPLLSQGPWCWWHLLHLSWGSSRVIKLGMGVEPQKDWITMIYRHRYTPT